MSSSDEMSKTADFCRNFPPEPDFRIKRESTESILEHIERKLVDYRIVYVEGEPLYGKTRLLADFMLRRTERSAGVFLTPSDKYFYTPDYVRLVLSEQIYWVLRGVQMPVGEIQDEQSFKRLIFELQRYSRTIPFTFIIDGLEAVTEEEISDVLEIVSILPFGQSEFRFVISAATSLISRLKLEKQKSVPVPLMPATQSEVAALLAGLSVSGDEISQIKHFCRGSIGQVCRFRDLLVAGRQLSDLLDEKDGTLAKLLEFEWSFVQEDKESRYLLAYIAFSMAPVKVKKLSQTFDIGADRVLEKLNPFKFLNVDREHISMRSEAERRFLRSKLESEKSFVLEKFINDLKNDPKSDEAIRNLPHQLWLAGKNTELIERLDIDHFVRLLDSERSLLALKRHCYLGLEAARKLNDRQAEKKFSLISSAITGLRFSSTTKSEIEARLKLGERENAVALALAAPTSEEKLQLLTAVAKELRAHRVPVSADLKQQLRDLVNDVDFEAIGEMGSEIACDLVVVDLDLANEVLQKFGEADRRRQKLGISSDSERTELSADELQDANFGSFHSQLSEENKQRFANAVATLVEQTPAEKFIERLLQLEEKQQFFMAKQWISRRRDDPSALQVANVALDACVRDLSRPARLQDFREIATVLPYAADWEAARQLIERIEAQLSSREAKGTSVESIRLQMLIARAKYKFNVAGGDEDVRKIFEEIDKQTDISIRATCFAWMLYGLQRALNPADGDAGNPLIAEITERLLESIDLLLDASAEHFETAKSAIYALTRTDSSLAVQLVSKLNTQRRRDEGYRLLAKELVAARKFVEKPGVLLTCVSKVGSDAVRESLIIELLSSIAALVEEGRVPSCNAGILGLWREIRVAHRKFNAGAAVYRLCRSLNDPNASEVLKELERIWELIPVDWLRLDYGFGFVRDIADLDRELAHSWLKKINESRSRSAMPSKALNDVVSLACRLAAASYPHLSPTQRSDLGGLSRLGALINSVTVPEQRISLWCELGIRLYYMNDISGAREIYDKQIYPLLYERHESNERVRDVLTVVAAPFVYLVSPQSMIFLLDRVKDTGQQDTARSNICRTIFRKRAVDDLYKDPENGEYDLEPSQADAIVSVLGEMSTDAMVFGVLEDLCSSLASKKNNVKIRRTQVTDILEGLLKIVEKRLPDKRNIKHDGFLIASKAYILRARSIVANNVSHGDWDALMDQAWSVPNVADRVVVVAIVCYCAKGHKILGDGKWFDNLLHSLREIPTSSDRVARYIWVARLVSSIDKTKAGLVVKEALYFLKGVEEYDDLLEEQRRLLDIAHSLDPDLVDKIIDLNDSDEASISTRRAYVEKVAWDSQQKNCAENPARIDFEKISIIELSEMSREIAASLISRRSPATDVRSFERLLAFISSVPLPLAYWSWNWFLENAVRKVGPKHEGRDVVVGVYDSALYASELALALIGRPRLINVGSDSSTLINPGERDQFFERIRSWAINLSNPTVYISDPYFGVDELEIVRSIWEICPGVRFRILTGKKHLSQTVKGSQVDEVFRSAWTELSDLPPPDIEVVVIGIGTVGTHPIHDRWILAEESGLRLGSSANSIGGLRISEISEMDRVETLDKRRLVERLLDRRERQWEGERLNATSFFL